MGQQQLLLIVLGVIIVGIAIVVGINLFNANAEESAKDTLVSEGTNLAALAQQHYKKPIALGGGGNTFTGGAATPPQPFAIPTTLVQSSLGSNWTATVNAQSVVLANVIPTNLGYAFTGATITVTPTSITSVINQ